MRNIATVVANDDWTLDIVFDDGIERRFDCNPLLDCEAFEPLRNLDAFKSLRNCGYFVEWLNDIDLSADALYIEGVVIL